MVKVAILKSSAFMFNRGFTSRSGFAILIVGEISSGLTLKAEGSRLRVSLGLILSKSDRGMKAYSADAIGPEEKAKNLAPPDPKLVEDASLFKLTL